VVAQIARRDPRVHYHCHPENIGLVRNFIYGMEKVGTPFFHFLSDDDLVFPQFFERAIGALTEQPDAILFSGATIWVSPVGEISDVPVGRWRKGVYRPPDGLFAILQHGHPDFTGTLFRREVLDRVGTLDEATGNAIDRDFLCRCAAQYPIVISTTPCAVFSYNLGGAGSAHPYQVDVYWPSYDRIAQNIAGLHSVDKAQRLAARDMILKSARRDIFLRGCKAAANGYIDEAREAAAILRDSFREKSAAFVVSAIFALSTGGLRPFLIGISKAFRRIRMKRRRERIPTDIMSNCTAALWALLGATSSGSHLES
jgi:hypothetical protein